MRRRKNKFYVHILRFGELRNRQPELVIFGRVYFALHALVLITIIVRKGNKREQSKAIAFVSNDNANIQKVRSTEKSKKQSNKEKHLNFPEVIQFDARTDKINVTMMRILVFSSRSRKKNTSNHTHTHTHKTILRWVHEFHCDYGKCAHIFVFEKLPKRGQLPWKKKRIVGIS